MAEATPISNLLATHAVKGSGHHNTNYDGTPRHPNGARPPFQSLGVYDPGRSSKATQTIMLRKLLIEEGLRESGIYDDETGLPVARIQQVVRRIYDEAEAGEAWAANLIFDRIGGKAPTTPIGEGEGPCVMLVVRGASTEEL
jgi:hypothetical protein